MMSRMGTAWADMLRQVIEAHPQVGASVNDRMGFSIDEEGSQERRIGSTKKSKYLYRKGNWDGRVPWYGIRMHTHMYMTCRVVMRSAESDRQISPSPTCVRLQGRKCVCEREKGREGRQGRRERDQRTSNNNTG
jgi:hypothetical protein